MIVCIAEKPSVAKDIARIIGANQAHNGYMEGNGYQVTWTFGHLCTLKEPDDYTPLWKRWSLGALPMLPQRFGIKLINDEGIRKPTCTLSKSTTFFSSVELPTTAFLPTMALPRIKAHWRTSAPWSMMQGEPM